MDACKDNHTIAMGGCGRHHGNRRRDGRVRAQRGRHRGGRVRRQPHRFEVPSAREANVMAKNIVYFSTKMHYKKSKENQREKSKEKSLMREVRDRRSALPFRVCAVIGNGKGARFAAFSLFVTRVKIFERLQTGTSSRP